MFGKLKKLGTAIEMAKGPGMSIDDTEYFWVNDRIEYYETNGRLLTKDEMKLANNCASCLFELCCDLILLETSSIS